MSMIIEVNVGDKGKCFLLSASELTARDGLFACIHSLETENVATVRFVVE